MVLFSLERNFNRI